jgi:hypothetical protein
MTLSGPTDQLTGNPFWVYCTACDYQWALFYTPLPIDDIAKFKHCVCPMGCKTGAIQWGSKPQLVSAVDDAGKSPSKRVMEWLASGDTGVSSESLAFEFMGTKRKGASGIGHPHDPADLGRCLRLIHRVPEVRRCVDSLATEDEGWAKCAAVWDEIAASMADEVGIDWSKGKQAPITYKLMERAGL